MVGTPGADAGEPRDLVIIDVGPSEEETASGIAVTLVEAHGGQVRLHLTAATAELLCEQVAAALEKRFGPRT